MTKSKEGGANKGGRPAGPHMPPTKGKKKDKFKKKKHNQNQQQQAGGKRKQGWAGAGAGGRQKEKEAQQVLSVYKRVPVLPPAFPGFRGPMDRFLRPSDPQYDEVLSRCYDGFVVDPADSFPPSFHERFRKAFEDMESRGMFLFDLTQPAGLHTKVVRTFVTRCLVGEPGITYKYLGLRMFAYPWQKGEVGATASTSAIGELNTALERRTSHHLQLRTTTTTSGQLKQDRGHVGSCRYNLTLINRCYPEGSDVVKLKNEPTFGKDRCTVSWHADSTLEHYSSIAVYHYTKPTTADKGSDDDEVMWRVALRVRHNAEGPKAGNKATFERDKASVTSAPALAVPLPSKHAYYLLDDFNHHHQHSVLAGSTDRFASTHRVCRTEGHTFASIKARCKAALNTGAGSSSGKQLRAEQNALNELEFEWIRQMYIQGEEHYRLHDWWHGPMAELLDLWVQLSERVPVHVASLHDATHGISDDQADETAGEGPAARKARKQLVKRRKRCTTVDASSFEALILGLVERHTKREGWHAREKEPAFHAVPVHCRPMPVPFPPTPSGDIGGRPDTAAAQSALEKLIKRVRTLQQKYAISQQGSGGGGEEEDR